ncbi:MAG: glycoside hydrolase family 13 protein [Clostridia bacterium]|nr:glycoside hydrolase family 13 protein [Clostridia bacterium]
MFYYNPLDKKCKSVIGAVREGTKLKIKVFTDISSVTMYVVADDSGIEKAYPMKRSSGGFFAYLDLPVGLYWYHFASPSTRYGRGEHLVAGESRESNFQLSVFERSYVAPSVMRGGIVYQIFPDRFCKIGDFSVGDGKVKRTDWGGQPTYRDADGLVKNNEFFGGNFKGIRSKLKYLKSLGVTVVYLNPIVKAYSSHRYDTGDYMAIDPVLGTEKDLKSLINAAKKAGISFIFDGVYNHTGADSVYFNKYGDYAGVGAYQSKKSPYFTWYRFSEFPDKYSCWWNFSSLPAIRKDSEDFQRFICGTVLKKCFDLGFKGVRLDVVDELSGAFVERIKSVALSYSADCPVVGEVWEDATNKIAYGKRRQYFLGRQLDSVMNYALREAVISYLLTGDTLWLVDTMKEQVNNYSAQSLSCLMNVMSTHDTPRLITVLGRSKVVLDKDLLRYESLDDFEYERGKTLAKLAYAIAYTCYGSPSVFYGDEAGLFGDLDPYNRGCYPWGEEDKEMLSFMTYLGKVRKSSVAIRKGDFTIVYADKYILVYERRYKHSRVIVAVSRDPAPVTIKLDHLFAEFFTDDYKNEFTLPSDGVLILRSK